MANHWNNNNRFENRNYRRSRSFDEGPIHHQRDNYDYDYDDFDDDDRNMNDREEEFYSERYGADRDFLETGEFNKNRSFDRDRSLNRDFATYGPRQNTNRMIDGYSDYTRHPSYYGMGLDKHERNFRGRGPKSYRRSDERLKDEICEVLTDHSDIDATEIEVDVKDGVVTLSGTVNDKWMKYHAEDVIENMSFVNFVQNDIKVSRNKNSNPTEESTSFGAADKTKKSSTSDKKSMSRQMNQH